MLTLKRARFMNLLLSGMLVGNEFGGWVAVHPALNTLPLSAHIAAEQAVVRRYKAIMPLWMMSAIVSAIPVLVRVHNRRSPAFRLTLAGMICFLAMLTVTFRGNMPINKEILLLSPETPPANWYHLRKRWDQFHTLRNLLNIVGLSCLILAALTTADSTPIA
jgi:uncharacterized membrane protein